MRWWTSLSPSISREIVAAAAVLLAACALSVSPARAQDDWEKRLQRAIDLYNKEHIEEACEIFQELNKEKAGHAQVGMYVRGCPEDLRRLYDFEKKLFEEGERLFQNKQYEDARQRFEQALRGGTSFPLKNPRYRAQINKYLGEIKQTLASAAKSPPVAVGPGAKAPAQSPKPTGRELVQAVQNLVAEGRDFAARKEYQTAQEKLKAALMLEPNNRDTKELLGQVQEHLAETTLRNGLQAYFEGKYDDSERLLSDYLKGSGHKKALALFFRGASYSVRYFLSGEKDANQKQLAMNDFRSVPKDFQPPSKFVSPKIADFYAQAVGATSR